MDARTLTALKGSIRKWTGIVAGRGVDKQADNCALCEEFNRVKGCGGCPVRAKTGTNWCLKSPFEAWDEHHETSHPPGWDDESGERRVHKDCAVCRVIAQAELDFLKSLLPRKS